MSGYDLWHRRLGHYTNRNIRETITHSTGLEDLQSRTFEEHTICPSCMIGKSTLEDLPKLKDRATEPLHQVNMDIFSSSVQSIKGYNYAVVLVDCNSGYRWIYGMKLKSDMLKIVKKWYSNIAILRQKHKLLVVMRDNTGEDKSQEVVDLLQYFTRAMAEWTSKSSNQIRNDVVKDNHGGIWARRSILVHVCFDGLRGPECHLQSTDQHYPMEINAWRKEGCVPISSIRVQGLSSSQLGTKRERQAYASGN